MRRRGGIGFGFWLVFQREFGWFRRRPFLLALTTLVPLLLMGLLSFVFSEGLATRLPIGVIDLDGTTLSRTIIRNVHTTPEVAVTTPVVDLAEGRRLLQAGRVHGLLLIPENLERDVAGGRRPEVVFFYNAQTLSTGNVVLRGVRAAVSAVQTGIRLSLRASSGEPIEIVRSGLRPIPVQANALFNPTLNYIHFLLATLLPSVLQIVIITTSAYSVGMDVETPHRLRILRRLGGGLWPAIAGKILPYTLVFLVVLGISDAVLFGVLGVPLRGHAAILLCAGILFILCCQFIGALLALLTRSMTQAVGIGTLLAAPAFGFMGIGFPRIAMNSFAYYWGACLPGTWYLTARVDQTVRGTPVDLSWQPLLALLAILTVAAGLTAIRLEAIRISRERATRSPEPQPDGMAA